MLRRAVNGLTGGKLMISNGVDGRVYYRVENVNGVYTRKRITGNRRLVNALAHKSYEMERLRRMEHNLTVYEKMQSKLLADDPQSIITALPKGFETLDFTVITGTSSREITWPNPSRDPDVRPEAVTRWVKHMTPEEWASAPYCENTKELKNKTHRSCRGIACRSKGEASLLDVVDSLGFMYRYDCVITIDGMDISPDLIIIRPDGKLIFVEHHGWIEDRNGDAAFLRKLWTYSRAGIVQGRNLLVTFDKPDGSTDLELIRHQLQNIMEI